MTRKEKLIKAFEEDDWDIVNDIISKFYSKCFEWSCVEVMDKCSKCVERYFNENDEEANTNE